MIEIIASVIGSRLYSVRGINNPQSRLIIPLVTLILFSTWGFGLANGASAAEDGVDYQIHMQEVDDNMVEVKQDWFDEMQSAGSVYQIAYASVTPILLVSLKAVVFGARVGYHNPNLSASILPIIEPISFSIVFLSIADNLNAVRREYYR